jgi:hypothetical protein
MEVTMIDDRSHILLMAPLPLPVHIRAFCRCAVAGGRGCMRRPRLRRHRPGGRDGNGSRDDGSGDDGDGGGDPPLHLSDSAHAGRRP